MILVANPVSGWLATEDTQNGLCIAILHLLVKELTNTVVCLLQLQPVVTAATLCSYSSC